MKKYLTLIIVFLLCVFTTFSCKKAKATNKTELTSSENKAPKNIILLIGDGMGLSQVSASQFYNNETSNFDRFSIIGLIKTSAHGSLITDSAAAATALASGVKTYNGAIGVTKDSISVETIVEQISNRGIATGLIATSSITHATPASFYAHVKSRSMYEDIAYFLVNSDIDFFAGGGLKFFNKRKDKKDLIAQLKRNGFDVNTVVLPQNILSNPPSGQPRKQAILLAEDEMPKMNEGRGDFLPNATKLALEVLSKNENGFFLMIEGSQIDWGGHDNDSDYLISELLDFDKTIGLVLDFAIQNGETLVIVTADHETGGFTLSNDGGNYNKIKPTFSTNGHSATLIPVFAEGPGASLFGGIYENTAVYTKMISLFSE